MGRHHQLTPSRSSRSAWVRPLEHDSDVIPGNSSSWRGPGQLVTSWSCVESGVMFTPSSTYAQNAGIRYDEKMCGVKEC